MMSLARWKVIALLSFSLPFGTFFIWCNTVRDIQNSFYFALDGIQIWHMIQTFVVLVLCCLMWWQKLLDAAYRAPALGPHYSLCCINISVQLMLGLFFIPDHPSRFFLTCPSFSCAHPIHLSKLLSIRHTSSVH